MVGQSSLFDNRYRYDLIYPRGRSGETLRAVDTHDHDRPVVIKRPAPQDAPPMRAAQEVSILAEKKALERLSGHPVLTELRGSGTFRAGGSSYQYIAMDRAEGEIVETLVRDLAASDQILPELEMLVIIDKLLDLLIAAHAQQVIYNDVDSKHLFWNRETYRLKVIDWGNAAFLDEPGAAPGVTVATDIYQVGELIYFLYQQGARFTSETTPEGEYRVIYNQPVPAPIQDAIFRATHPAKNRRFATLRLLRDALTTYRQPLERARDQQLQAVKVQLVPDANKELLGKIDSELNTVLLLDPGHPEGRRLQQDIRGRLRHLSIQADFEAIRIYLETGNWARAIRLMEELIPQADPPMASVLAFLVATADQMDQSHQKALPEGFDQVIQALMDGQITKAADALLDENFSDLRHERLLLAERLIVILPGVVLLRPHLVRLAHELQSDEIEKLIVRLNTTLEPGLSPLIDRYGKLAIQITDLLPDLESSAPALIAVAERAESATREVIYYLRRIAETLYSDPKSAEESFDKAYQIDPDSKPLAALPDYLKEVRGVLASLAAFKPDENITALENWFQDAQAVLEPYQEDITDPGFLAIARTLSSTLQQWHAVGDILTMGRQRMSIDRLQKMAAAVRPHNAHVAAWFENNAKLIKDGSVIERFSPNQALSEMLVNGYAAWDQGQSGRAADQARRALTLVKTPGQEQAVERLAKLAEVTNQWLSGGNVQNPELTQEIETAVFDLLLDDEQTEYNRFSKQMKNENVYLKAMKLGIVAHMKDSSSAGYRLLFFYYVLQGVLTVQEDKLEDAEFWKEAALVCGQQWQTHPVYTALDGALTRRRLVLKAEEALNQLRSFSQLYTVKQALNAPLAEEWLKDAQQAITQIENALGQWSDGDFRGAREAFNKALDSLDNAEKIGGMHLDNLQKWLIPYRDRAVELVERRQIIEQAAMTASLKPDTAVIRALEQIVDISEATLGDEYSRQVRLWRDLYKTMLRTHTNQSLSKREKIAEFDINFSALFVNKHPAYRLFQRWSEAARALPDDVKEDIAFRIEETPPSAEPEVETEIEVIPIETAEEAETEYPPSDYPYLEETPDPYAEDDRDRSWNGVIIGAVLILVILGAVGIYGLLTREDGGPVRRFNATATRDLNLAGEITRTAQALLQLTGQPTSTPITPTSTFTATPQPITETLTPTTAPILTGTATLTPTSDIILITNTPPPSLTPIPPPPTDIVIAPDIGGKVDALRILNLIQPADYGWEARFFSEGAGGVWQLGATVEDAGSAPIAVIIDPEFLETFNPDTGHRLRRAEVTMELTFYDEAFIQRNQVFFGLGLQNNRRQRYTAQVQIASENLVSLGINENGTFRARSEIPMSRVEVVLAFQRRDDGSVDFFIDGQLVGSAPAIYPLDEPISLVLYSAGGGMFVSVSSMDLELAPYVSDQ